MAAAPLISIVIPSYQQAKFLEACLRSVIDQDYPNKEIIVMDGGSADGSVDIIRRYAHRLADWQSEPDKGQAHAVNLGWAKARGEILGWLNSDDCYAPGALREMAEAYARTPSAAMWYGDVDEIDPEGRKLRTKLMEGFDLPSLLLGKNMGQPGVFVARFTYQTVGGLDESLGCALDFEYFLRIWSAFPAECCIYIPRVIARSRLWGDTKSSRQAERFGREYRQVIDAFFGRDNLPESIRVLRSRALSRAVLLRHARLLLESQDWQRGFPHLMAAIWQEPEWVEKARMLRLGMNTWRNAWRAPVWTARSRKDE
jgi:glycosyltransferase involved in cell wall biosynthesis